MLICFDLGGILVRICRSWQEGCRAADVPLHAFTGDAHHPRKLDELISANQVGELASEEFYRRMSQLHDEVWSAEEIGRVHASWILGPYSGTAAFIRELNASGHVTACLSNTDGAHWPQLLEDEAIAALHHRHASHLLQLRKPDPAIWTAFEDAVEHSATDIVFFDDLPENIESARNAGWDAVLIDPSTDTVESMRVALRARGLI